MGDRSSHRRRGLRRVVIAAVALVALAGTGVLALPEIARRVVVWRVAAMTGRPVTLAALELDLLGGRLALRDLCVTDHDQGPLVTLERLEARFSLRDLVRGHVRITDAALEAPTLRIVRSGPTEFNISDLLDRASGGGAALAVTLERLALRGGAVTIEDRTLAPAHAWRVEAATLEVRGVSTLPEAPPGVVTLGAVAAGSPISLWLGGVRLAPLRFHATVIAREIDASLAALYLPPGSPLSPARGKLDVSATIEQQVAAGLRVSLDAVFSDVELRRPGRETAFLSAPAVRVTLENLRLRGGAVELERLAVDGGSALLEDGGLAPVRRWQAKGIALEARTLSSARDAPAGVATARAVVAGSPVSVWVANLRLAPLEWHAMVVVRNVDFALFRLYVPPDLPVQPERGVVNASVRIDHDARRGTRLALDAGLSGVELRRPAHFVTAPSLRVTAEDIAFGGGALSAGRVALAGDRLTIEDRTLNPARTWAVQNLAVEASRLSSRRADVQGIASARATVAGASVSAWLAHVRLDPLELNATAILRDLDLRLVQLYLPAVVPLQLDRGAVNASVQVSHDVAGGTRLTGDLTLTGMEARGRDQTERLAVSAPSLRVAVADARRYQDTLDVGRLEITGSGSLVDSHAAAARVDLERLRIATEGVTWPTRGPARVELSARLRDGGEVDADGTMTGEPASVDLRLVVTDGDLVLLQPYLPFRAGLRSRVDATLAITGPLSPAPRLHARGDVTLRSLALSDAQRPVLTVEGLSATGIDAVWPERLALEKVRVRRSWALLERDRQGGFLLRTLLERAPGAAPSSPAPVPGAAFQFRLDEGIFEDGSATIVDAVTTPPARFEIAGARLAVHDVAWPSRGPMRLVLSSPTPGGGRLDVGGTLTLDPVRLEARAALNDVELAPAQPYLPIDGRVAGRVTGDLGVTVALDPITVKVGGEARLQRFLLSDGDRPVVTVGRVETVGIDVDWPARVAVERVRLRRPSLLIERDAEGEFVFRRLVTPRWPAPDRAGPAPTGSTAAATIEVRAFMLERASARFVDRTTAPPFGEQLSDFDVTLTGLTTAPGRRMRFTGSGALGGGTTFKFEGEAAAGERPILELKADLREFPLPRANPYLDRFTAWTATRGTMSASATYHLAGARLDARHEIVVRHLEVAQTERRDEVEQRLGMPLGFLVTLLKDARGEIRLSVPVSGDLSAREFDFREAVWGGIRNLAIRLLALPFSRVGSLFFSEDSKVTAVTLAPVVFEPGTARLGPAMVGHLERVAAFLLEAPSVSLRLAPILTQADLDALKRELATEELPPDALRDLGARRLDVVRQALTERGRVDTGRLAGSSRRIPLVEAAGAARVELDLRP